MSSDKKPKEKSCRKAKAIQKVRVVNRQHLCFKHAQLKMCHSPKVEDGVEIIFLLLYFLDPSVWTVLLKNFKLPYILNR